jgi:hypothetical protein
MDRDLAIRNTHPTVVTINVSDDGTEAWDKDGNVVVLNESLITEEMTKIQTEYDALDYARKRDAEYPSIKDQLDKIYHEGIDKWKEDMIKPVKDKHPKA